MSTTEIILIKFKIKNITSFLSSAECAWRKYWLKTYTWAVS